MELSQIMFFVIVFSIVIALQILVYRTFNNFLKRKSLSRKKRFFLAALPFIVFNLPLPLSFLIRGFLNNLEGFLQYVIVYPFYIFQGAIFFIGLFLLIGKIVKAPFSLSAWLLSKIAYTKEWFRKFKKEKPVVKFDESRRKFLTGSTAVVSSYAFIGAGLGVLNKNNYKIEYVDIPIKNLPHELVNTKFTLISDVHSGPYMDEDVMNEYVEVINNLDSDYFFISGDLTNTRVSEATPFTKAFKQLNTKRPIFATLGNHDYFDNADEVAKIISNETPIRILRNESELLDMNGKKFCLLGVDDTRNSNSQFDPVIMEYTDKTIEDAKKKSLIAGVNYEELPKVMLYHKPYMFDATLDRKVDLTLSGHTHGGQVVLAKFGNVNISPAATVSEYVSGLYRKGDSSLYVSRGLAPVGLPIRLNCPPEVTVLRLVKA